MFITLQHLATLNHTTPNYTSLHLSTLNFLSFTLHYSPIWLNTSTCYGQTDIYGASWSFGNGKVYFLKYRSSAR